MKVTKTTTITLNESEISDLICDKLRRDGYEITGGHIKYNITSNIVASTTSIRSIETDDRFTGCTITIEHQ